MRFVRVDPRLLLAAAACCALWPRDARAEDECSSDAECVELYTDGFTCEQGTLGRYCLEPGCVGDDCYDPWGDCADGDCEALSECDTDDECVALHGEAWACADVGAGIGQCVWRECETDDDCRDLGPAGVCATSWEESWCEEDPGYVPPFRSCAAAPGRAPRGAWPSLLAPFVLAWLLRRRARSCGRMRSRAAERICRLERR